ncbi:AI-2E family transporter [Phreatobacter stygius]|uniref:AI-2E family transporter n=1 Tax=Phreatobacter stygius TaxID=1940610 RepID=A0A4D7B902_9HYPH|nr:AI-2E family transporter [Phreatobacter stygius]QCI67395.1 AI-2E family transporter [Phreatobacter stygius]
MADPAQASTPPAPRIGAHAPHPAPAHQTPSGHGSFRLAFSQALDGWSPRSLAQMAATVIGLYLCYLIALPFLSALAFALALAVLAAPLQRRLESLTHRPGLSAALSVALVIMVVVVPFLAVGQRLAVEAAKGAGLLQAEVQAGNLQHAVSIHPWLGPVVAWIGEQIELTTILGNAATWLTNAGTSLVTGSMTQLLVALVTFYLLFYFLRDRRAILGYLRSLSPLREPATERLFRSVDDTIHATVYGTFVTALLQGALGGLMFWFLGLPTPLLWGLVMAILAIVPVLGAFIVWFPAALYLAITGDWGKAAILTLWGGIVIGGIDNVLYPLLVGGRIRLHTVPMFIAMIGGLALFGAAGLVLGPLTVTITLMLIEQWRPVPEPANSPP